jgi:RNA polymerase sigma-70 factor, ECF subfamily
MASSDKVIDLFVIGDIKAFEMTFKQLYQPLVHYSHTIVKDLDEAEDIVQQAFVGIWQKRDIIKIDTSFKSYLYRAVYNASLNWVKHHNVRQMHFSEVQAVSQKTGDDHHFKNDLQNKVDWALEQLPEQCAKVFKLSRFEHMKYQEIANALDISVKTVENHMGKALKLMRDMLKEYLPVVIIFLIQGFGK